MIAKEAATQDFQGGTSDGADLAEARILVKGQVMVPEYCADCCVGVIEHRILHCCIRNATHYLLESCLAACRGDFTT